MDARDKIDNFEGNIEVRNTYYALIELPLLYQLEAAKQLIQNHPVGDIDFKDAESQIVLAGLLIEEVLETLKSQPKLVKSLTALRGPALT